MAVFHFDLRHVEDQSDLLVDVHGAEYGLAAHTAETLAAAREKHPAFAALPPKAHEVFTHYSEVDDSHFEADGIRWVKVVRPAPPGVLVPEVVLMTQHLPEGHLRAFYRKRFELAEKSERELRCFYRADLKSPPRLHSAHLVSLGLNELPDHPDGALDVLVNAQKQVTPLTTAAALMAHHPNLANVNPHTATVVMHDHILPDPEVDPDQYNSMQSLAQAIADPKHQPWSPTIECKDQHGNPMQAEYSIDGIKKGQQLHTSSLSERVLDAVPGPSCRARRTASDDGRLQGHLWHATHGTSSLVHEGTRSHDATPPACDGARTQAVANGVSYKWTLDNLTWLYGVKVDPASIKVDANDHFSVEAYNIFMRTLYAGYQLYDEAGKPKTRKEVLTSMSAVNSFLGFPVPTDPTELALDLDGAASIEFYFGSLGTCDWDEDVSWRGALLTGLWQYGVPMFLLLGGTALTSTRTFNQIVNDKELRLAALAVLFPIVGGGVATASALYRWKKIISTFSSALVGILLKAGLRKLGAWLLVQAGKGGIKAALGPVGWALRLAAAELDVENMVITTGEVLASPAGFTRKVTRALDVAVTLHPDPAHGEAGRPDTAVWPAVAQTYSATLQYQRGTNRQLKGTLPATTSNDPVHLLFANVPAGGKFRITFGVYSANGWLAGSWQSDWQVAKPNQGTTLNLGNHTIKERLVPLAPDTQYEFKEKVTHDGGKFVWKAGDPPAATRSSLHAAGGGPLYDLVGITMNNSAFQVGYAWQAAKQGLKPDSPSAPPSDEPLYVVQGLSVLEDPGSRLKSADIGLTHQPAIAYDPTPNTKEIEQTNFLVDPRGGGMHLRQVKLGHEQSTFGLGDANLQSWGRFPLENIDALAVHPSNLVIACSYRHHKMMILKLPDAPTSDEKAQDALVVSGEGIRQGLMRGPKALVVAPDGRILVLESLNQRVQAFDTKGNPVPSFTPFPELCKIKTAQIAQDLDAGSLPEAFNAALQELMVTFLFALDSSFAAQLDSAQFEPKGDPLIKALSEQGVSLSYDADHMTDPKLSAQIQVVESGQSWIITDPRGMAWQVLKQADALNVYHRVAQAEVRVQKPGHEWLILDHGTGGAWKLIPSTAQPGETLVRVCQSWFPLRPPRVGSVTYLDMAIELQGYVYVLAYRNDGAEPTDYLLDVYSPEGAWLFRTPDPSLTATPQNVVAGRITVDVWRNLFALAYELLPGEGVAPQPGLAHWNPTPPLFDLDKSLQRAFNDKNIGVVVDAFKKHGHPLSKEAYILVKNPEGAWEINDPGAQPRPVIYHVYRTGDKLEVYSIPA